MTSVNEQLTPSTRHYPPANTPSSGHHYHNVSQQHYLQTHHHHYYYHPTYHANNKNRKSVLPHHYTKHLAGKLPVPTDEQQHHFHNKKHGDMHAEKTKQTENGPNAQKPKPTPYGNTDRKANATGAITYGQWKGQSSYFKPNSMCQSSNTAVQNLNNLGAEKKLGSATNNAYVQCMDKHPTGSTAVVYTSKQPYDGTTFPARKHTGYIAPHGYKADDITTKHRMHLQMMMRDIDDNFKHINKKVSL